MKNFLAFNYNPLRAFYIVFTYIIIFSMWWAFLLYNKNHTVYETEIALMKLQHKGGTSFETSEIYTKVTEKYNRQRYMILGEGLVFILLLAGGLIQVKKSIRKEMDVAEQQTNFLHSVTHELKSPVASIKLNTQTALKKDLKPEIFDRLMNNSLLDVDRLENLIDNILLAAKIEHSSETLMGMELNLSDLVNRAVKKYSFNKKNIIISGTVQNEVFVRADAVAIASVVFNLVENAVKYSSEKSSVVVNLSEKKGLIKLEIVDFGIGIPNDEKSKIFDKFYRVGNEETRTTKGTGLGLYIVKKLVDLMKGDISVSDNSPAGTVFLVTLPSA